MLNKKIVAFGDSLTFGHGLDFEQRWTTILESSLGCTLINLGISGQNTKDAIERIDEVISSKPDIITFNFGTNDFIRNQNKSSKVSTIDYQKNLNVIFGLIRQTGCEVIIISPHQIDSSLFYTRHGKNNYLDIEPNKLLEKYVRILEKTTIKFGFHYVNLWNDKEMLKKDKSLINLSNSNETDGVHYSEFGANIVANKVIRTIRRIYK